MVRSILCLLVVAAMVMSGSPMSAAALGAPARRQSLGEIAGTAVVEGKPLNNITVRVRNIDSGSLAGEMKTNALGQFRLTNLPVGNYIVETVAPNGTLLGTSTRISLQPGAMVASGVTVTTSAAAAAAVGVGGAAGAAGASGGAGAAGAGAAGAGAAGAGGAFFASTAGIVTVIAVGAGVAFGVAAVKNDASPSR